MNHQVIMIGGMPRSGTTLMSNYLQQTLNIPVSPETHYFSAALSKNNLITLDDLPQPVLLDRRLGPIYRELEGSLIGDLLIGFEDLLDKIFDDEYEVIGEKTPSHLMKFLEIAERRDSYRFIVMNRSCAQVCSSLKKVPWNDGKIMRNSFRWLKYYIEAERLKKRYPGRVCIVNYNDLCSNPEAEISRVMLELGLQKIDQDVSGFLNYKSELEPWKRNATKKPSRQKKILEINIFPKIYLAVFEQVSKSLIRLIF
jgi:hypothetical protein